MLSAGTAVRKLFTLPCLTVGLILPPGENKGHFVPAMVGPLLEVTLVPETELRRATLPLFYDMMEAEQSAKGCFKQVRC